MVLYFSGTGNSKHVAEKIAQKTNDVVVSMNELLKQNRMKQQQSESKPFIFVCSTYAWRIPHVVDELIRKIEFTGSSKVYFVMTCGGETANAIHHVKKLCQYKNWELQGFAEILMPDNYLVMFPSVDKKEAEELLKKADTVIEEIAEYIHQGKKFFKYKSNGVIGKLESGAVNNLFYSIFVQAKGFYVTEKCIGCEKCVKLCPLNNITMKDSKPVWENQCTHCMACICGCPKEAIEYKNKTQGKTRYSLKHYTNREE
ncbi:EFR1 family ferrodoxin [Anaerosporobacter sp.]|uniref:EFR1 family ferrodoxin n=1 Tax=Anaerosporobacter sp. TaxID=1872529 RepID=UPI00286ECDA9|nr:EFR1 family ferrodoxin [Anaerosporobacter sp.]